MRTETGKAHGVSDPSPRGAEWKLALKFGEKKAWGVDEAAVAFSLDVLPGNPYPRFVEVEVDGGEGKRFGYAGSELLHCDNDGCHWVLETFEDGDDRVFVGWVGLSPAYTWKLDAPVPGDVDGQVGEVEDHAELGDEQADGAGLVAGVQIPDPSDDVGYADLVYRRLTEFVHELTRARTIARQGPLANPASRGEPLTMHVSEQGSPMYHKFELYPWVLTGSEPFSDQGLSYYGSLTCPECAAVLNLRVTATPAVADVEPAAVPGVPGPDVEGRQ